MYNVTSVDGRLPLVVKIARRPVRRLDMVREEYRIYQHLRGISGVPQPYHAGEQDSFSYFLMPRLWINLLAFVDNWQFAGRLRDNTTAYIAVQMVSFWTRHGEEPLMTIVWL